MRNLAAMAREVRHFTATIPAGTPLASPVTVSIAMPPRVVRSVYWRVPAGAAGTMGWQLAMGGVVVIPTAGDKYIIANDEHDTWYPEDHPDSGAWQVIGYNTGANPHSVYLAFSVDFPYPDRAAVPVLTVRGLSCVPDLSAAGPPLP